MSNNNSLFDFQSLKNKWVAEQILERHLIARNDSNIDTLDFSRETLIGLNLDGAVLSYPDPDGWAEETPTVIFDESDLRFASLCGCYAPESSFQNANLSFARLAGSDLTDANFEGANLACADFSYVRSLAKAKFTLSPQLLSADFTGTDVSKASFYASIAGRRRVLPLKAENGRLAFDGEKIADEALRAAMENEFTAMRAQADWLIATFGQHVRAAQAKGELPGNDSRLPLFMNRLEATVKEASIPAPVKKLQPR
jgi:hypothetical protein